VNASALGDDGFGAFGAAADTRAQDQAPLQCTPIVDSFGAFDGAAFGNGAAADKTRTGDATPDATPAFCVNDDGDDDGFGEFGGAATDDGPAVRTDANQPPLQCAPITESFGAFGGATSAFGGVDAIPSARSVPDHTSLGDNDFGNFSVSASVAPPAFDGGLAAHGGDDAHASSDSEDWSDFNATPVQNFMIGTQPSVPSPLFAPAVPAIVTPSPVGPTWVEHSPHHCVAQAADAEDDDWSGFTESTPSATAAAAPVAISDQTNQPVDEEVAKRLEQERNNRFFQDLVTFKK